MCVGAKISANERILEKIHEKAHNFGTKVRIFHSSHMFSAEKVSSLTRLFHLREAFFRAQHLPRCDGK